MFVGMEKSAVFSMERRLSGRELSRR